MIKRSLFLEKVREIDSQHPEYKLGGDGGGGVCDCIGLVIGAIRRAGGKWSGIHGSNYAARKEVQELIFLNGKTAALEPGMIVFKKYEPGESGWALPDRYSGDPDQRDYYHVGVVMSVNPLNICHCTSPTTKHDSRLGKWTVAAKLTKIDYTEGEETNMSNEPEALYSAIVNTKETGLNLRAAAGGKSRILGSLPKGATVEVLSEGKWPKVRYDGMVGYASGEYLLKVDEEEDIPQTPYFCIVDPLPGHKLTVTNPKTNESHEFLEGIYISMDPID